MFVVKGEGEHDVGDGAQEPPETGAAESDGAEQGTADPSGNASQLRQAQGDLRSR